MIVLQSAVNEATFEDKMHRCRLCYSFWHFRWRHNWHRGHVTLTVRQVYWKIIHTSGAKNFVLNLQRFKGYRSISIMVGNLLPALPSLSCVLVTISALYSTSHVASFTADCKTIMLVYHLVFNIQDDGW